MEDAARAIIRNPRLLLPVILIMLAVLLWWMPQLVVFPAALLLLRRWIRQKRLEALAARVVERHRE